MFLFTLFIRIIPWQNSAGCFLTMRKGEVICSHKTSHSRRHSNVQRISDAFVHCCFAIPEASYMHDNDTMTILNCRLMFAILCFGYIAVLVMNFIFVLFFERHNI